MPHVTLRSVGTDLWEGPLEDFPGDLLVSVFRDGDVHRVRLWKPYGEGRNPCGGGELQRDNGRWVGTCDHFGAPLTVSGVVGSSRLEFSEREGE